MHTGLLMLGLYYASFYWLVILMFNYAALLTEYKLPDILGDFAALPARSIKVNSITV